MRKTIYTDIDEYGDVIYSDQLVIELAYNMKKNGRCLIGWTDEDGSHYDILFMYRPDVVQGNQYNYQRGIKMGDLFVSIIGAGSFGFKLKLPSNMAPGYIGERLHIGGQSSTTKKLTKIINAVVDRMVANK